MRRKPGAPADLILKDETQRGIKRETRTYRFLTYVMGGGVKVNNDKVTRHFKERDEHTPIRVASIRGQLRFWWRACNPQCCTSVADLHAKESEIWGSSEVQSSVKITIAVQPKQVRKVSVYEYVQSPHSKTGEIRWRMRHLKDRQDMAYGAFPIQPSNEAQKVTPRKEPGVLYDYAEQLFSIRLEYDSVHAKDVEMALWAWETFGGLGGRTRRGFGAIEYVDASRTIESIREKLLQLAKHPSIPGVPSLAHARFARAPSTWPKSVNAWEHGLRVLRMLRQGANLGRNPPQPDSKSPAGRSRWPEAEGIREITNQRSRKHAPLPKQADRFPRAVFGMPIEFHFQDGATYPDERDVEPADTTLKPANADRMASPLIIRPIREGDVFRACALVLTTTLPERIILKTKDERKVPSTVVVKLDRKDAEQIQPMKINGNILLDPLDRFLEELKK
ncbi:MAG TPA: type III-B CRISPR module RAMP protein Cmr1 [Polyangium sp.]|nr:type III-B CRISPR module RAMP protein Cmr1 [Polyangium sp.]